MKREALEQELTADRHRASVEIAAHPFEKSLVLAEVDRARQMAENQRQSAPGEAALIEAQAAHDSRRIHRPSDAGLDLQAAGEALDARHQALERAGLQLSLEGGCQIALRGERSAQRHLAGTGRQRRGSQIEGCRVQLEVNRRVALEP